MVPGICTQCGAAVSVDAGKEFAYCEYCGTKFSTKQAIINYNIQHAAINHADTVNVYSGATADNLIERGFILLEDGQPNKARKLFDNALNTDPKNWKAYLGMLLLNEGLSREDELGDLEHSFEHDTNYLRCMQYAPDNVKDRISSYVDKVEANIQYSIQLQQEEQDRLAQIAEINRLVQAEKRKNKILMIVSIISALLCIVVIGIIPSIICLVLSIKKIRKTGPTRHLTIALIASVLGICLWFYIFSTVG